MIEENRPKLKETLQNANEVSRNFSRILRISADFRRSQTRR